MGMKGRVSLRTHLAECQNQKVAVTHKKVLAHMTRTFQGVGQVWLNLGVRGYWQDAILLTLSTGFSHGPPKEKVDTVNFNRTTLEEQRSLFSGLMC
jgi:hypothetical protein